MSYDLQVTRHAERDIQAEAAELKRRINDVEDGEVVQHDLIDD